MDELMTTKEIIRRASLVGTDAKQPERRLIEAMKQLMIELIYSCPHDGSWIDSAELINKVGELL